MPSTRVKQIKDLEKGDHIKFRRGFIIYAHHAIVTNKTEDLCKYNVIHFTGDGKPNAKIKEEEMQFHAGNKVLLVTYNSEHFITPKFKRLPRPASVAIAEYCKNNNSAINSYNAVTNNCEHFIYICTLGYAISFQQMKLFLIACLVLKLVDVDAMNVVVNYMMRERVVVYNEGDDHLTLTLQSGEKDIIHFKD